MKKIAILGASGHGQVVADLAEILGFDVTFFDDGWPMRKANGPWRVVGRQVELLSSLESYGAVIVAIGDNAVRAAKQQELSTQGVVLATLVHPQASVSRHASVEQGSVIFAGAVVNVSAKIGQGVIINTGATVDHECTVGDFAHISPGANLAGKVQMGARAWVGIGASVKQGICIGSDAVIGAGAAVVKDVPDGLVATGVPARYC